jgi:hypothetical protein
VRSVLRKGICHINLTIFQYILGVIYRQLRPSRYCGKCTCSGLQKVAYFDSALMHRRQMTHRGVNGNLCRRAPAKVVSFNIYAPFRRGWARRNRMAVGASLDPAATYLLTCIASSLCTLHCYDIHMLLRLTRSLNTINPVKRTPR